MKFTNGHITYIENCNIDTNIVALKLDDINFNKNDEKYKNIKFKNLKVYTLLNNKELIVSFNKDNNMIVSNNKLYRIISIKNIINGENKNANLVKVINNISDIINKKVNINKTNKSFILIKKNNLPYYINLNIKITNNKNVISHIDLLDKEKELIHLFDYLKFKYKGNLEFYKMIKPKELIYILENILF